jgi:hypothetical protein
MSDATGSFSSLIAREAGSDSGGGRRRRTRGPKSRRILCHPSKWWSPELQQRHVQACQAGMDANGEWKLPIEGDRAWAMIQELGYIVGHLTDDDVFEVEVP